MGCPYAVNVSISIVFKLEEYINGVSSDTSEICAAAVALER